MNRGGTRSTLVFDEQQQLLVGCGRRAKHDLGARFAVGRRMGLDGVWTAKVAKMENERIVTRLNTVWLGEDGIARVIHIPGAEMTLEDAHETMAAYQKINEGKRRPLFVDTRSMKSIDRGAREYFAGEEAAKVACAVALMVDTPVSRVLGNFYLGVSHPHLATRLFTSDSGALTWLREYVE